MQLSDSDLSLPLDTLFLFFYFMWSQIVKSTRKIYTKLGSIPKNNNIKVVISEKEGMERWVELGNVGSCD